MLSTLYTGKTHSHMIVIEDGVSQCGSNLLKAFIHNASIRQLEVHVLCFENPVESWRHILKDHVHLHDCFTDHRSWNNDSKLNDIQSVYKEKGLFGAIQKLVSEEGRTSLVCIDSLTPILFNYGLSKCYRDLHALLSWSRTEEEKLNQVIAVIHKDAIPNKWNTLTQLRHLATTLLQIEPSISSNTLGWGLIHVTHRKTGGKIIKQLEEYYVDKDYSLASRDKKNVQRQLVEAEDPTIAVQSLTTFKLTLNPQEEQARSQLVLPYTRQSKSGEISGGGKVFYEPDAADDWDDEDPDDDLDV